MYAVNRRVRPHRYTKPKCLMESNLPIPCLRGSEKNMDNLGAVNYSSAFKRY